MSTGLRAAPRSCDSSRAAPGCTAPRTGFKADRLPHSCLTCPRLLDRTVVTPPTACPSRFWWLLHLIAEVTQHPAWVVSAISPRFYLVVPRGPLKLSYTASHPPPGPGRTLATQSLETSFLQSPERPFPQKQGCLPASAAMSPWGWEARQENEMQRGEAAGQSQEGALLLHLHTTLPSRLLCTLEASSSDLAEPLASELGQVY